MVIAGPGTGKTQILAMRIGNILIQTDTDPRNIPTGTRRGDPTNNDWFYTATITIGYRLGSGLFNSGGGKSNAGKYNRCYKF